MHFRSIILGAAALTLTATMALAAGPDAKKLHTGVGDVLVGPKGMTLYTFDNDKAGVSNCYDACAVNWPPFFAAEGADRSGAFSVITRKDGKMQWAYNDMPLYYWKNDKKPGDTTGDGVKNVWHVIK